MPTAGKPDVLLVEDDKNLGFVIKDNLEMHGFNVTLCEDGEIGYRAFKTRLFDICILDIMLPKKDGFSLAENIRQEDINVPIIFLSAKSMKEDRIAGFKIGADDYITKPFSIEELILRIEVFLKRSQNHLSPITTSVFKLNAITFDYTKLSLVSSKKASILTQKEADILKLFCEHKNEILKREEILQKVWGNDDYFMGRSLDVFISRLRSYLKDDPKVEIVNIHGIGFKLVL